MVTFELYLLLTFGPCRVEAIIGCEEDALPGGWLLLSHQGHTTEPEPALASFEADAEVARKTGLCDALTDDGGLHVRDRSEVEEL